MKHKPFAAVTILACILLLGHLLWAMGDGYTQTLAVAGVLDGDWAVILSRLGLLGYIALLLLWHTLDRTGVSYLGPGDLGATIQMPFIWRGWTDRVWRVAGSFSLVCLAAAGGLAVKNGLGWGLLGLGLVFSLLNTVLEELLWRGLVLARLVDLFGPKAGLVVMSAAFGLYHYPLGYSLPVCLFFSLGGIYFGGVTIRSGGLRAALLMHLSMNLLFVALGIIF